MGAIISSYMLSFFRYKINRNINIISDLTQGISMEKYQQQKQIQQDTPEWYQARAHMLTASTIASALHLNSYRSHDELLKAVSDPNPPPKTTITLSNFKQIDPKTWGIVLESIARQLLEQSTQQPIGKLGLKAHDKMPFLGASPDGVQIIDGEARLIEIKCPKTRQITYRVPIEYWVQMQIQMEVWNIDQTLYCEYKFDLTTEKPTSRDLTDIWGQISPGVFWVYQTCWTTLVYRDKEWFKKIKPQIINFYHLKFNGANPRGPPGEQEQEQEDLEVQIQPVKKGKRKRDSIATRSSNKQLKTEENQVAKSNYSYSLNKERSSINRLTNFLRDDPIVDWLNIHGTKHGYEKDKSMFLDFYNQKNIAYKLEQIRKCIFSAKEYGLTYRVLNISVNNVLDVYHDNNLLLKLQYDVNLLEETQHSIKERIDIIFMGQLSKMVGEYNLWDTFDILIRREHFLTIFPGNKYLMQEISSDLEYIPIKIKFTSLDFNTSTFELKGKHKIDKLKIGTITESLIMGRSGEFGIVPENEDYELIENGISWLESVEQLSLNQIYPNMKNEYDSPWHSAKTQIAHDIEELTQIRYLNLNHREILHQHGITKISQLTPNLVNELGLSGKKQNKIIPHISDELYLPPLDNDTTSDTEVYLDFESVSSLGTDEPIIFLMGILVKNNDQIHYHPFLVKNLDKRSEKIMLEKGLNYLASLGNNITIFHWSNAEERMLKTAGYQLPDNCEWFDLYKHISDNDATIPGCYTYGLKDVANRLYELGKIESTWLNGLDGTAAMVMAWNIDHKCKITGENFKDDPRIQKLCSYNYIDCQVMEELKRLL